MDLNKWKRLKKSGSFKRKVQKTYKQIIQVSGSNFLSGEGRTIEVGEGSVQKRNFENCNEDDSEQNDFLSAVRDSDSNDAETSSEESSQSDIEDYSYLNTDKKNELRNDVRNQSEPLLLDIIIVAVIKAFVRRRRPVPMNKLIAVDPDKYSFPSGHASRSVLIASILMCLSPVSVIFYPPLLAWVVSVLLSRVLLERHYLLDVLAGCGLGVIEGLIMNFIWFSQSTSASILSSLSDEKLDGGEFHV